MLGGGRLTRGGGVVESKERVGKKTSYGVRRCEKRIQEEGVVT